MKRSWLRRLERLEARVAASGPRRRTEEEDRYTEVATLLLQQMNGEHARILLEEVELAARAEVEGSGPNPWSAFRWAFHDVIEQHIRRGRPLALPAEVAAIYLTDNNAEPLQHCEGCGYALPVSENAPFAKPPRIDRAYFEQCPLCGGNVGYACTH